MTHCCFNIILSLSLSHTHTHTHMHTHAHTHTHTLSLSFSHTHTQILVLCFKMYRSSDTSVHNTAGVAIRQIVSTMFDRLSALMSGGGDGGGVSASGREKGEGKKEDQQLPTQAKDAYLLFQVWQQPSVILLSIR